MEFYVKPPSEPVLSSKLRKAIKHEDHWYLDGSIIIYIDGVLFRLHRSALVRKSTYFASLLEDVGDGEGYEKMGGCPVVEVEEEEGNADDFAVLLNAMDDVYVMIFKNSLSLLISIQSALLSGSVPFPTLAAILRAATCYDFTSMRDWAVKQLEEMWPNTLASVTPMRKLFAAETLKLARDCEVPTVLKRVLYELVRRGGFGLPDVEDDIEDCEDERNITFADSRTLISAREHLVQEWVLLAACAPARLCNVEEQHHNDPSTWARLVHKKGIFEERMYDPLVGLGVLANIRFQGSPYPEGAEVGVLGIGWKKSNWCPTCAPLMVKSFMTARQKIWEKLDIWFGIE